MILFHHQLLKNGTKKNIIQIGHFHEAFSINLATNQKCVFSVMSPVFGYRTNEPLFKYGMIHFVFYLLGKT